MFEFCLSLFVGNLLYKFKFNKQKQLIRALKMSLTQSREERPEIQPNIAPTFLKINIQKYKNKIKIRTLAYKSLLSSSTFSISPSWLNGREIINENRKRYRRYHLITGSIDIFFFFFSLNSIEFILKKVELSHKGQFCCGH